MKRDDMQDKALRIIHDEHRSLSAVLSALKELARLALEPGVKPDFAVLRAMIYYIDAFPERLHHPKEDEHLFTRVLERDPGARALIDELARQHKVGARMVRDLEQLLLEFEQAGKGVALAFAGAVNDYAQFHWSHMRKEELELLPLASRCLTPADWERIAEAFAGNGDPIADLREQDFDTLFHRIVSLAPAPVGLGAPWKAAGA